MADLTKYQAGAGRLQGGNAFYVKEEGLFQFYNTEYEGRALELFFKSRLTHTVLGSEAFSVGHVSGLPTAYGYFVLSAATGASLGTLSFPAASKGAFIRIDGTYLVADANVSVTGTSTTGLILNTRGSDLSSFELSALGYIEATSTADGTWQIVSTNVVEHASS